MQKYEQEVEEATPEVIAKKKHGISSHGLEKPRFDCPGNPDLQSIPIDVKGGKNVYIADLRALYGVVENDFAMMGGLIIMEPLSATKERIFKRIRGDAGDVQIGHAIYPRQDCCPLPIF